MMPSSRRVSWIACSSKKASSAAEPLLGVLAAGGRAELSRGLVGGLGSRGVVVFVVELVVGVGVVVLAGAAMVLVVVSVGVVAGVTGVLGVVASVASGVVVVGVEVGVVVVIVGWATVCEGVTVAAVFVLGSSLPAPFAESSVVAWAAAPCR